MCSVMMAIEYSYKLDTKNDFNLWCELGRFLHRQSHLYNWSIFYTIEMFVILQSTLLKQSAVQNKFPQPRVHLEKLAPWEKNCYTVLLILMKVIVLLEYFDVFYNKQVKIPSHTSKLYLLCCWHKAWCFQEPIILYQKCDCILENRPFCHISYFKKYRF